MKKVKDFKEGDRIETNLLVTGVVRGITNTGSPYLTLSLQDSTKSIDAKLWDVKADIEKEIETGKVFNFTLEINTYRNNLQAKVISVLPVDQNTLDLTEYIVASPVSKEELRDVVNDAVKSIGNKNLAMIVTALLKHYDDAFYEYPAASKIHHNFYRGLATHTYGMIKLANCISDVYSTIDRDYLIAGTIIHDLGKIEEITSPYISEYTTKGKLLGHISILDAVMLEIGNDLKLQDSEELLILRHMVLSHHGELEFGSPIRPRTLEAEVLSFIDNLDAKINILDKALVDVKEGEFSQKVHALDERTFYKHK